MLAHWKNRDVLPHCIVQTIHQVILPVRSKLCRILSVCGFHYISGYTLLEVSWTCPKLLGYFLLLSRDVLSPSLPGPLSLRPVVPPHLTEVAKVAATLSWPPVLVRTYGGHPRMIPWGRVSSCVQGAFFHSGTLLTGHPACILSTWWAAATVCPCPDGSRMESD